MRLFFLEAGIWLRKTHSLINGQLITQNYPMAKHFTSHEEEYETLLDFYRLLDRHAHQGHALLKGQLAQPLVNESKAGQVNPLTETRFLVFDLDGLDGTVEDFITKLPEAFHSVSYIRQYSAGHGLTPKLKAHLFFLLQAPTTPGLLKNFILDLNLTQFDTQITLQPGNLSLSYPIDPQVNNNAVPLFICPPFFNGCADPVEPPRTALVKGASDFLSYDFSIHEPHERIKAKIKDLRIAKGLSGKKSAKYKTLDSGVEIVTNIDPTTLIAEPFTERGFTYLPINRNNPYTFYHPEENARLTYNFYGNPPVETKTFLPDYWAALKLKEKPVNVDTTEDKKYLIFRDLRQDTYYNGWSTDNELKIYPVRTKDRLNDFARQNGLELPDPVPDWIQEFNPTNDITIDFDRKYINTFRLSPYLREAISNPNKIEQIPPTIHTVIWSVVGYDQECYDYFINWIAFIAQFREKTNTAWVFQGIEGTGKGALYNLILKPIFGANYCAEKMLNNITDQFNGWLQESLLVFFDETKVTKYQDSQKSVVNTLKNLITESECSIRIMRTNPTQSKLYCNFIFASNEIDSLHISTTDRRYNVCPQQQFPLTPIENMERVIEEELQDFTHYLMGFKVNKEAVRKALNNEAKAKLRYNGTSEIELFFLELSKGNFDYFAEVFEDVLGLNTGPYLLYKNIIHAWALRWKARTGDYVYLRRDELHSLFCILLNISDMPIKRFTRLMTKYNLIMTKRRNIEYRVNPDKLMNIPCLPLTWVQGLDTLEHIADQPKPTDIQK